MRSGKGWPLALNVWKYPDCLYEWTSPRQVMIWFINNDGDNFPNLRGTSNPVIDDPTNLEMVYTFPADTVSGWNIQATVTLDGRNEIDGRGLYVEWRVPPDRHKLRFYPLYVYSNPAMPSTSYPDFYDPIGGADNGAPYYDRVEAVVWPDHPATPGWEVFLPGPAQDAPSAKARAGGSCTPDPMPLD